MTTSENQEQVFYLWECPKCRIANQAELLFCPNCAFNEGLAEPTPERPEKNSKIAEALGSAIDWSLKHGQLKPAEVLAQATKRHRNISSLADLRLLSPADLNRLADNFLNLNRLGATGAGLTAGLPGGLAAFATIPADISALVYFALRCVSGVSQSFSLETTSETGQTIELLAFAYGCRFETLIIGQRRLENIQLAAFLLQNPEHTRLVKACLLKQLSAFLTVDFAKTSWASFLPVVGGVVNGVDHYWFIGEVGKRGKQFYRALLPTLPAPPRPANLLVPGPVTLEVREERVELAGEIYDLYLVSPVSGQNTALVVVVGERAEAEKYAEKLGLAGIGALALDRSIGPAGLTKVWAYLHTVRPVEGLALLGLGDGGNLCLEAQTELLPRPVSAVFYDLKPLAAITRVEMPLLVQLDAGQETGWVNYLQPTGEKALVSINTFDDFAASSQAAGWAWRDTLDWFNRAG